MKKITTPLTKEALSTLRPGDELLLSGTMYTARDQAHKRICQALAAGKKPPFPMEGALMYYCGPTRTPKGKVIGSCGPTTSSRMDAFTPAMLKAGLAGMVGKGSRGKETAEAIRKHKAVYFVTYAGCGALLSSRVKKMTPVAYKDLGPEAIYRLEVEDFPLIVAIDSRGTSIY